MYVKDEKAKDFSSIYQTKRVTLKNRRKHFKFSHIYTETHA